MVSGDWEGRACPSCCFESGPSQLEVYSHVPAEHKSFESIRKDFVGLRAQQSFFSYYRCLKCGLLYNQSYFSDSQISILYEDMPDNLMGENMGSALKTQYTYADQILKHVQKVESYLELGPDLGLLAKRVGKLHHPKKGFLLSQI